MKTYDEMAERVLQRGHAIASRKNRRKKMLLAVFMVLLPCCVAAFLAAGNLGEKNAEYPTSTYPSYGSQGEENTDHPMSTYPTYESLEYLSIHDKTNNRVVGVPFQYITRNGSSSGGSDAPPDFSFSFDYLHVVAKAVEEYPGVYETLNEYGSTWTYAYRLFRMQVIDPLESNLEGEFFYLLPKDLAGDLTQYDALLISMYQLPKGFLLRCGDQLVTFDYLFTDYGGTPELGNIIAFSDGIFDESLWQDPSWRYGYQFGKLYLDRNDGRLLVSRGSTLTEALQRWRVHIDAWYRDPDQVRHYDYQTEEAKAAMDYLEPFENGVFLPMRGWQDYVCYRYINGCPTNEWISISDEDETVTTSEYRFEDADFECLPSISQFIAGLHLSSIAPQHTDPAGKVLLYQSAVGWYEKTENGVYSIVRIAWRYREEGDYYTEYYDETFLLLDENGVRIVSREELIGLIGENRNIFYGEYGVGIEMPME